MIKIYDYKCKKCGKVVEKLVDSPFEVVVCKNCNVRMDKLVSSPGMVKGNFEGKPGFRGKR